MTDLLLYGLLGLALANFAALLLLWRRAPTQPSDPELQQQLLALKFAQETLHGCLKQLRNDLTGALSQQHTELHAQLGDLQRSQSEERSKGRTETSAIAQASSAATNRSLELVHTAVDVEEVLRLGAHCAEQELIPIVALHLFLLPSELLGGLGCSPHEPPRRLVSRADPRWPQHGRHILAAYDDETTIVYQAYRAHIA
jgi:hypothetical protein